MTCLWFTTRTFLLQEVKNDPNFDRGCRLIVNQRVIAHALDYRLRPRLRKACQMDLEKFCARVLFQFSDKDMTEDFLEGRVLKCLQSKFAESAELLTSPCRSELLLVVGLVARVGGSSDSVMDLWASNGQGIGF